MRTRALVVGVAGIGLGRGLCCGILLSALGCLPAWAASTGDVTADGRIDGRDALQVERAVKGLLTLSPEESARGDVHPAFGTGGRWVGDGILTEDDALRILYRAVGLLPEGELTGDFSSGSEPVILDFSPKSGPLGTIVTIRGRNFVGSRPEENEVFFGDVPSAISQVSSTEIGTRVPAGAASGILRVRTPGGATESPLPFTVTAPTTGQVILGAGLNVEDFTVVSVYGETDADPQTGEFTLLLPEDRVSVIGAVPKGAGENSFLAILVPEVTSGTTQLSMNPRGYPGRDAQAAGKERLAEGPDLVVDARSTARALVFFHPFFASRNAASADLLMTTMETVPEVDALAAVVGRRYSVGAAGIDDPEVCAAWQQAVIAVMNALPEGTTFDVSAPPRSPAAAVAREASAARQSAPLLLEADPEKPVKIMGVDLDYLKYQYHSKNRKVMPGYSVNYSPVDWLVALERLDPADMPNGLSESFADIKKRDIRKLGYQKCSMMASNQWTVKIDLMLQGWYFLMDTVANWVGLGSDAGLPLQDNTDGIYMLRAYSGSFKDRWKFSGDDSIAFRNVPSDATLANMATGVNIVMVLSDVWGLVAGKEGSPHKDAIKAGLWKCLRVEAAELGSRTLGDLTDKEALEMLVKIMVETGKHIAYSYEKEGLSRAQKKLQGSLSSVLGQTLPLLKVLTKIAFVGRIGERIVGLMGYIVNPLGLEIAYGPTPLEAALVMVGDPFSPVIDSLSPTSGGVGTEVTLRGKRFALKAADNAAWMGGLKAEVVSVNADGTELTIRVPEEMYETGNPTDIRIETPACLKSATIVAFVYRRVPVITGLGVLSGFAASQNSAGKPWYGFEGTLVDFQGYDLGNPSYYGRPNHRVFFGATEAAILSQSSRLIQARVPLTGTTGPHDVYLRYSTETGTEETTHRTFNVLGAPTVGSIAPSPVMAGGLLDIRGTNLFSTQAVIGGRGIVPREVEGGVRLFVTMPDVGTPGEAVTVELWNPAGSATKEITRAAGIDVPDLTPLPYGLRFMIGSMDVGLSKDGLVTLDEAMMIARGELNYWTQGYDDTNWEWKKHWYQYKNPDDTYYWVEGELNKYDLKTNGLGHEGIAHIRVNHYFGGITGELGESWEDLDNGSDANHMPEEGDRVSEVTGGVDVKTYNGANFQDVIETADVEQTMHAGNGILMGPQDKIRFKQTTLILAGGDIVLKEGNEFLLPALQTSSPIQCTQNRITVGHYYTSSAQLSVTGSGIVISSAFGVTVHNTLIKSSNGNGVFIDHGGANRIVATVQTCTGDGLRLEGANENTITFSATGCGGHGAYFSESHGNTLGGFSAANCGASGLSIDTSQNNRISGEEITNCNSGIVLSESENNAFGTGFTVKDCQGNGVTVTGGQANTLSNTGMYDTLDIFGCGGNGLEIVDSPFNWINGMNSAGNAGNGIVVHGAAAAHNTIRNFNSGLYPKPGYSGNIIQRGNDVNGVYVYGGAHHNVFDATYDLAYTSGNGGDGILLEGAGTSYNSFAGCMGFYLEYSWTDAALGNGGHGVCITGGASHNTVEDSQIHGNSGHGILIEGEGTKYNKVTDTSVGTVVVEDGPYAGSYPNQGLGVYITSPADYNRFENLKVGVHDLGGVYCGYFSALPEDNVNNVTFENCEIGATEILSVQTGGGAPKTAVVRQTEAYGVQISGCSYSRFSGVQVKDYATGFYIAGQTGNLDLLVTAADCAQDGIYIDGMSDQRFALAQAMNNGGNGIVLRNAARIDFTGADSLVADANGGHGVVIDSCQDVQLLGYSGMGNLGDGLRIANSSNISSDANMIVSNGGDGVSILGNSSGISIRDDMIMQNTGHGAWIQNATDVFVGVSSDKQFLGFWDNEGGGVWVQDSQNVTLGNPAEGWPLRFSGSSNPLVRITGGATDNVQLLGASFSGTDDMAGYPAILIDGGRNITIGDLNPLFGNLIDASALAGIQAEGNVQNLQILNNRIGPNPDPAKRSSSQLPNQLGIWLRNGISGVIAVGNSIVENSSHGILLQDNAHSSAFTRNEIRGNGGDGFRLEGAGSHHNHIARNVITGNAGKGIALAEGNDSIAAPVIANISPSSGAISGSIHPVPPHGTRVEVYADRGDEGERLLGIAPVLGNNFCVNANVPPARLLHAVALHPNGNTSEFGPAIPYEDPDWYPFLFTEEFQGRKRIFMQEPGFPVATSLTPQGANEWDAQAGAQAEGLIFTSDLAGNQDVWLRSFSMDSAVNLTVHSAPDYSPSWLKGKTAVAFVSDRDGDPEIYSTDFDLTRPLGEIPGFEGALARTASRKTSDGLGVRLVAGAGVIRGLQFYIADAPAGFEWRVMSVGPDNKPSTLLASGNTTPTVTGWHTVDITPRECSGPFFVGAIYQHNDQPLIGSGEESENADSLYYTQLWGEWYFTDTYHYMIRAMVDPKPPTRLTDNTFADLDPAWSPDGSKIAFASDRGGSMDVWLMDSDGATPQRITDGSGENAKPAWSPDGTLLAFVSSRNGDNEIYTIRPDKTGLTRLTSDAADDTDPVWTPDGAYVLFRSDRGGGFEVFAQKPESNKAHRLTHSAGDATQPEAVADTFWVETGVSLTRAQAAAPAPKTAFSSRSVFLADGSATLTVALSNPSAKPGESVELTATVTNAQLLGNLAFELAYDPAVLELTSVPAIEMGGGAIHALYPDVYPNDEGLVRFNWVHAQGLTGNGALRFAFRVKPTALDPTTPLFVENLETYATDLTPLVFLSKDGIIHILFPGEADWIVF